MGELSHVKDHEAKKTRRGGKGNEGVQDGLGFVLFDDHAVFLRYNRFAFIAGAAPNDLAPPDYVNNPVNITL